MIVIVKNFGAGEHRNERIEAALSRFLFPEKWRRGELNRASTLPEIKDPLSPDHKYFFYPEKRTGGE
ncbi:MAG: hypothetical protein ACOY40_05060 [Bacillota bacterium]